MGGSVVADLDDLRDGVVDLLGRDGRETLGVGIGEHGTSLSSLGSFLGGDLFGLGLSLGSFRLVHLVLADAEDLLTHDVLGCAHVPVLGVGLGDLGLHGIDDGVVHGLGSVHDLVARDLGERDGVELAGHLNSSCS